MRASSGESLAIQHGMTIQRGHGPPTPDLVADSLSWNVVRGGVDFSYKLLKADLTVDTTAALYWATDPNYFGLIGLAVGSVNLQREQGTHGPVFVRFRIRLQLTPALCQIHRGRA